MSADIVARLRADALWFGNVPKHNKVHIDADKVPRFAAKLSEAADEIERLHRDYSCICGEMRRMMDERDEARRRVCEDAIRNGRVYRRVGSDTVRCETSKEVAEMMGWDCFKETSND